MEYFSQFKWAIPLSFADALSRCQFGEGDMLYPEKSAYLNISNAKDIGFGFQVLYPERQITVPKDEDVTAVFKNNWGAEVRLQKYSFGPSNSEALTKEGNLIVTTQGRLYTSVWKGDLALLEMDSDDPKMPIIDARESVRLIEITPEIKENGIVIQERVMQNQIEKVKNVALQKSKGKTVFAMPYDRSNSVSIAKYSKVCEVFRDDLVKKPIFIAAKKAGIDDWALFLPTVHIALFIIPDLDYKKAHAKVKKATYVKAKNRKTNRDAYSIKRHGEIFS